MKPKQDNNDDEERIDLLCDDLKFLLKAELAAGNEIVETWSGFPKPESLGVMLKIQFKADTSELPASIVLINVNDIHWWKAEYHCQIHQHILACRF